MNPPQTHPPHHAPTPPASEAPTANPPHKRPYRKPALITLTILLALAAILTPLYLIFHHRALTPLRLRKAGWNIPSNYIGPDFIKENFDHPAIEFLFSDINSVTSTVRLSQPTEQDFRYITQLPHLDSLVITHAPFDPQWLYPLNGHTRLTGLGINNTKLTDAHLQHLNNLPYLTALSFQDTLITDAAFQYISQYKTLRSLYIYNADITGSSLHQLEHLSSLEVLAFDNTDVTGKGLEHIAHLPLKYLGLSNSPVTSPNIAPITRLAPTLWYLELSDTEIDDSAASTLAQLNSLRVLNANNTNLADNAFQQILTLHDVNTLALNNTRIPGNNLTTPPSAYALTRLELNNTPLTNTALQHLARITSLQELYLRDTNITDAGLKHIAELTNLSELDIAGTKTTYLSLLPFVLHPVELRITHDPTQFTTDQVNLIRQHNPNLRFVQTDHHRSTYGPP